MSSQRLSRELERIYRTPARDSGTPRHLAIFPVSCAITVTEYLSRIRGVLHSAIAAVQEFGFDLDEIPVVDIPSWFVTVSGGRDSAGQDLRDAPSAAGCQRYTSERDDGPWGIQEWLFRLDPDARAWAWWDATPLTHESVLLWVDPREEYFFPNEELQWLAYVSGARKVEGPILREISDWWRLQ